MEGLERKQSGSFNFISGDQQVGTNLNIASEESKTAMMRFTVNL